MNNRLSIQQLAQFMSERTGKDIKLAEKFLREFVIAISKGIQADNIVKVKGIGAFKRIKVEDRESVNINTGERFLIAGHYKVSYVPDKDLKELINKPFSSFEAIEITDHQTTQIIQEKENIPAKEEEDKIENDPPIPQNNRNKNWLIALSILLVIVISGSLIYMMNNSHSPVNKDQIPEKDTLIPETTNTAKAPTTEITETNVPKEKLVPEKEPIEKEKITSDLATVKIKAGERLTLLSLKYFGHKVFWVYIYMHNKSRIANPNNVPIGTKIVIPSPALYGIDASKKESLEKATAIQAEINQKESI